MDKNLIRKTVLRQRRALPAPSKSLAESLMLQFLQNWEVFKNASAVHIFLSTKDETETRTLIELCWNSEKKTGVPVVLPDSFILGHTEIKSFKDLKSGAYGILEPIPEQRISMVPEMFDLVIVPGVAFDRQGGRLGHGKGYYDRFLEQTSAFRLGLAFDCQLIDKVPVELHDVPMHAILTESGIVEINS